ncbi:hypothetical protein [Achromobacter xylosoxidans]|nr:hypothetical protein [Achromobacter xylosoxidans]
MSDFGRTPAYPQSVVYDQSREQVTVAYAYGAEIGLNVQQHVWLTIFASHLADPNVTYKGAVNGADAALPLALKRLEELA